VIREPLGRSKEQRQQQTRNQQRVGIAMLALDGLLDCRQTELETLARFANRRIVAGIAAD
jgi:hypothetical protein